LAQKNTEGIIAVGTTKREYLVQPASYLKNWYSIALVIISWLVAVITADATIIWVWIYADKANYYHRVSPMH